MGVEISYKGLEFKTKLILRSVMESTVGTCLFGEARQEIADPGWLSG